MAILVPVGSAAVFDTARPAVDRWLELGLRSRHQHLIADDLPALHHYVPTPPNLFNGWPVSVSLFF